MLIRSLKFEKNKNNGTKRNQGTFRIDKSVINCYDLRLSFVFFKQGYNHTERHDDINKNNIIHTVLWTLIQERQFPVKRQLEYK